MSTGTLSVQSQRQRATDPVFRRAAESGLVWLPERGMGYLPIADALTPYDAEYFEKYVAYAATGLGAEITRSRVSLVQRHAYDLRGLIDVGIGCGSFVEALADSSGMMHRGVAGFDINPVAVDWLMERGLYRDPYLHQPDALTFWDSLEHIPDVWRQITNAKRWVFCSVPIVPGDGPPAANWKHLRRDEHCWYFTRNGLIRWMRAQGFGCVEHNTAESLLGREDIETFAFRRQT